MMRVKLGYLISQYPAVNHTFILREVLALREGGFDVRAVSVRRSDRPLESLSQDELEEHLRTFSIMGAGVGQAIASHIRVFLRHPIRYVRGLWFAWALTRGSPRLLFRYTLYFLEAVVAGDYFERQDVSFIHTHFSSTVLLILSRVFPIRYSLTVHGPDEFNDVVGFHMAEKVAGATFVSTISHYASSQVMRASDPSYWRKVIALRLGVDPELFLPRPSRVKPAGEPFRLVFVGRLAPAKALHLLVEVVDLLRRQGRKVELTLVGGGPARSGLETFIQKRSLLAEVRLVGACNNDRVADFYRQSDAFVLASFAEGVPIVLMEAMAMEVPCVSTWIAGIPELIENEVDGLLVPPASPEAIANAVARLMDNPELAQRIGKAGRQKVMTHYNLARNAERLGEVFLQHLTAVP